jgi:uncharacterized protein (TIGR03437 family)
MFKTKIATMAVSVILMAGLPALAQQTVTVTYSYNGLPLPIFTDEADVITIANITVPRALKMSKVTVQLQIQYPNTGDLDVSLYSPEGTEAAILRNNCNVANVDTTFDDQAASRWSDFCPVEAGRGPYRANDDLARFNGDDSSYGVWRLAVTNDTSNSRSGWITGVTLTITGTTQVNPTFSAQTVLNAASRATPGVVAPGELIAIFGVNIGPTTAVTAPAGALPTTLGGTTVTINGNPARIAYASQFRVDVQVPFGVVPGTTINVQVNANNQLSPAVTLNVVEAAPGLYTTGTGPEGPIKAINGNGTVNSGTSPAQKGSFISVYASGMGLVTPPVAAGEAPPSNPLSTVDGDVGAFIGGVPARVLFAGLAPGLPGWYQLNIEVPATTPSGRQEVMVYSNGVPTQSGATVNIQ